MVFSLSMHLLVVTSQLSPNDLDKLNRGEPLISKEKVAGNSGEMSVGKIKIDASPDRVWPLVADCAKYPKMFPRVVSADVLASTADGDFQSGTARCRVTLALPWPLPDLESITDVQFHVETGTKWTRTWHLVSGDYHYLQGVWELEPLEGGRATLATYKIRALPKMAIPESMLKIAQEKGLPDTMTALKRAALKN